MATPRICSIPDCGKKHVANGLCRMHYTRVARHGDPFIRYVEPNCATNFLRDHVFGFNSRECIFWPFSKNSQGQGQYKPKGGRNGFVTRYVCEVAHGAAPSPIHHAAHSCGNGHLCCVNPAHLRWATPKENAADKYVHGTHRFGERSSSARLTEEDVMEIIRSRGKVLQRDLAAKFGVSTPHICAIQRGKFWKHITSDKKPSFDKSHYGQQPLERIDDRSPR